MAAAGAEGFKEEPGQNQQVIVHVREDSNKELDRLFAVALNQEPPGGQAANRPLQVPLKMRNLPASFWTPGPIGTKSPGGLHSRENSLDNSAPFSPGPVASPGPQPPSHHHIRTSSCPATLGQIDRGTSAAHQVQNLPLAPSHLRGGSFDVGGAQEDKLGPLPPGWEQSRTPQGQTYFLNHNNKSTQWEDPRKVLYTNAIRKIQQTGGTVSPRNAASPIPPQLQAPPQPQLAQPPQLAHPGAGPGAAPGDLVLPEGWEMKFTEAGEPYYVDHVTKKTQWQHPAITGPQNQAKQIQLQQLSHQWKMLENKKRALAFTRPGVGGVRGRSASHENVAMTQAQEMMMRHSLNDGANTNIDPFLASGQPGETHNRQESADSGLGMGSNFNLGSIPEDMGLETMDTADLDTTLTDSNQGTGSGPGTSGAGAGTGMETDQLISSLPELGEDLGQDIMQTILNNKEQQQQQQQQDPLWL